jgi:hypothetical protein
MDFSIKFFRARAESLELDSARNYWALELDLELYNNSHESSSNMILQLDSSSSWARDRVFQERADPILPKLGSDRLQPWMPHLLLLFPQKE